MATENDENPEANSQEASTKPRKSKVPIIGLIFLILASVGIFFIIKYKDNISHLFSKNEAPKEKEFNILDVGYLTLPDIIINLKSAKNRANVLKATFVLELGSLNDKEPIDQLKPIIIDEFQTYLRELELDEIQGSSGLERIRQELFTRVNNAISPLKIRKVLIKEFLTQ